MNRFLSDYILSLQYAHKKYFSVSLLLKNIYNFLTMELIMSNVIISNTIITNSIISAPIVSNLIISKLIISYSIIFTLASKSCLLFKFRLLLNYLVTPTINGIQFLLHDSELGSDRVILFSIERKFRQVCFARSVIIHG